MLQFRCTVYHSSPTLKCPRRTVSARVRESLRADSDLDSIMRTVVNPKRFPCLSLLKFRLLAQIFPSLFRP